MAEETALASSLRAFETARVALANGAEVLE